MVALQVDYVLLEQVLPKRRKRAAPHRHRWWCRNPQHGQTETVGTEEFVFDARRADRACNFFEWFLTHVEAEWAGNAFILRPWQRLVVRNLFGWVALATGCRRYQHIFLFLPRKNGKSTFSAGIALYCAIADGEPRAQVYSAAADKDQARLVFDAAKAMVSNSAELRAKANLFRNAIAFPELASTYRVLSSDAKTKHGFSTHCVVIDELHAHPNRDLFDTMMTSMGARRQPLAAVVTTAGYDRHSVCYEQYDYARKVERGDVVDGRYLPVLFEAEEGDDWKDPEVWAWCNPNLGLSPKLDWFEAAFRKAMAIPGSENTFKRLQLNIWTEQATRWLPMEIWQQCGGPDRTPEWWDALRGRSCYLGVDLSSTQDLTALVAVFPNEARTEFDVLCKFWLPIDTARERSANDKVPYMQWIAEGWITPTQGARTDQSAILHSVKAMGGIYRVMEAALDRWEATRLLGEIEDEGLVAFAHGQGYASMSGPSKLLERALLGREIRHGNNPVLSWCAANVTKVDDPAGNIKPSKAHSTGRIDGIVALIMALGRASLVGDAKKSVYDKRGRGLQGLK